MTLYPEDGALGTRRAKDNAAAVVPQDLRVGIAAGDTGYFGRFGGLPTDQHPDDVRSLVFETEPLDEELVLLGAAEVDLEVVSDQPIAQLALRLSDVAPDGSGARVGLAFRNLALLDGLREGAPLEPGRPRRCRVRFPTKACRFARGHRIRLSLSSSYWPLAWPAARGARLAIATGSTALHLPILRSPPEPLSRAFPAPLDPPTPPGHEQVTAPPLRRTAGFEQDGTLVFAWHQPFTSQRFPATGTTFGYETRARHAIDPDNPLSAVSRFEHRLHCARPDGVAEVASWAALRATADAYLLSGGVTATWDGETVASRDWSPEVPRRLS